MSQSSDSARSDRPNLEQKRKLAKELLKAVQRLDAHTAARFTWNHPRFRGKTGLDVVREGVTLTEAQHVIARESGFASWPKLKQYVSVLQAEPDGPVAAFEDAVRAIIRGDANWLETLLKDHPDVATMRSTRDHGCVLPHYIAANGVENEHQVVPANAPEIARILFQGGADAVVDATTEIYVGGPGSTPLVALVSSTHPHQAGVQAELVHVFCDAGANPNGIEEDGLPLQIALGFRYPDAATALAECGARIENLPTAAALGRTDLVDAFLDESRQLVSRSCEFPSPQHDPFPRSIAPHPPETMQQAFVFACMMGHLTIAKRLLDAGVDINAGPRCGISALHESCYQGQAEAAHFLLQHGADPTIRDGSWKATAIGWADAGGHSSLIDWLFQQSRVDILDAVELRKHAIVRRMLESNPLLVDAPQGNGAALRFAAAKGDRKMVELLLEFEANPTLCNENGHSAIDYAEKGQHQALVKLLKAAVNGGE